MTAHEALFGPAPIVIGTRDVLPASGGVVLRAVLRRHRMATTARMMFLQWPSTRDITEALAWHLTEFLPHPSGMPLLGMCVMKGFEVMACTQNALEDELKLSNEVMVAYLAGLFEHVAALPEVSVEGARGAQWDALASPPLGEWLKSRRPASVSILPELPSAALAFSPAALRLAVIKRVVPAALMGGLLPNIDTLLNPPY